MLCDVHRFTEEAMEETKKQELIVDEEALKPLPISRHICYGLGDFANNFSWAFVASFLMYFWTDVLGVSAAFGGTIMLVSRFWDAVNDPIVGTLADRTRTKWGSYRPWLLWSAIPMAIINVLAFTAFPIATQAGRNAYALITFFVLVFIFTCVNIPYSAMSAAASLNTNERSKMASFRLIGSYAGSLIVANFTLKLVDKLGSGDAAHGYMMTAVLYSVIMVVFLLVCFAGTKELCIPATKEKIPLKESFKALKGNTPVFILCVGFLAYGFYSYGRSAVAMYYFTYNAGNKALFATYSLVNVGGALLGSIIMPKIAHRFKNKASVPIAGFFTMTAIMVIIGAFIDPTTAKGITVLFVLQGIASICQGMSVSSLYSMIPDTTEYTQAKHGMRASGFISSTTSFAMKLGMGIGTASVGWLLGAFGYVAGAQQSASALMCIRVIFTFAPAVFSAAAAIALLFYKLDKATYEKMVSDLGLSKASK